MSDIEEIKEYISKSMSKEEVQEWLNFASDSMVGQKMKLNQSNISLISKDKINNMLKNPQANYEQLQNSSKLFQTTNGIYKRLVEYFSYLLTFDLMLVPSVATSSLKNGNSVKKSYETSALYVEKMNIKANLPIFTNMIFENGEVFLYKIEDKKGIEYKIIPNKYCLPYQKSENVIRYVINMKDFVAKEDATAYPKEISKACEKYKLSTDSFIEGIYYEVSDKGFCFTLSKNGGHAMPPFTNLFSDLINLNDSKELQSKLDKLNNTKMIHNKVGLGKDDKPVVSPELAKEYNNAIKANLDEGIFSITNPFESSVLDLGDTNKKTTTIVTESVNQIFNDAGVSDMLFSNQKGTSSEALKRSIIVDTMLVVNAIIPMFSDYITWEISRLDKQIKWRCIVLPFTWFNRDEIRQKLREDMAYGGSRLHYQASCGFTPLQAINVLKAEQLMGIDDLFVPAKSSHTQSSGGEGAGRPVQEDVGDEGDSSREKE